HRAGCRTGGRVVAQVVPIGVNGDHSVPQVVFVIGCSAGRDDPGLRAIGVIVVACGQAVGDTVAAGVDPLESELIVGIVVVCRCEGVASADGAVRLLHTVASQVVSERVGVV